MIKINLIAEKKATKTKTPSALKVDSGGLRPGQNLLLVGILVIGAAIAGIWWYNLSSQIKTLNANHAQADAELKRLEEIRKKGERYEKLKALRARKIELITSLKKQQTVPVQILDRVSRNLPDFLWLDAMTANKNQINISGKATNYNAVSSFYENLNESGAFQEVTLGRTFAVKEGVAFSLTCRFAVADSPAEAAEG